MSMSVIAGRLTEMNRRVATLESELAQDPDDFGTQCALSSSLRHFSDLQEQFEFAARECGVTVCKYRLFGTAEKAFGKICQAVAEFQSLYTLIFSAIKTGKRSRRQPTPDDERLSTFGLAYTFSGSIGVTLTLAQERTLFDEMVDDNDFDRAMGALCDMARLDSTEQIKKYAADFGVGVIRELHAWSAKHAAFNLGADIEWMHGRKTTRSVLVQPQELARLKTAIEVTSDIKDEPPFVVDGTLLGADTKPASFHFQIDGGQDIRGTFTDAISEARPLAQLPHRYRAEIAKSTVVKYATDEESVTWRLVALSPLPIPAKK